VAAYPQSNQPNGPKNKDTYNYVSEDTNLTPELNKLLDDLFGSTGKTPELIYDPDDKVVIEMVNQVRDKLAKEAKQKRETVWKYRNHK
jgi:hypothetical protein